MKKMKTLFIRNYIAPHEFYITPAIEKGCEWVINGEGIATRKIDGTACMVKNGNLFMRFDTWAGNKGIPKKRLKAGKPARKTPLGAIPCQDKPNEITGSFPVWAPIENINPDTAKTYIMAWNSLDEKLEDGTYELCGPHFNNNPEHLDKDLFIRHGSIILDVPRTFEGIKDFLENNYIEGIVFHRGNGEMCKIKRTDFNLEWNGSTQKRN